MGNWYYHNIFDEDLYVKQGGKYVALKEVFNKVKEIGEEYGVNIKHYDFGIDEDGRWRITPYEGEGGFCCQGNLWWGENMDSYTIRFMEGDFDMFDEITEYLKDTETEIYELNEEGEYV